MPCGASNLSLAYTAIDKADFDVLAGVAEFYLGDFYLAGGATHFSNGGDSTDFNIAAGSLPMDGLLVKIGYADFDATSDSAVSVGAKYVKQLANGTAFNVEGDIVLYDDDADTREYLLSGDYYINNAVSIGLRYADSTVSGADATFGAGARYFFTPAFSGELEYTTNDDVDSFGARLALRF